MLKIVSALLFTAITLLFITYASAQEKKSIEPPNPVINSYQELLWAWNVFEGRIVEMAEDFPEDKYNFKAQKDERTFGENLVHIAGVNYTLLSSIKGTKMGPSVKGDSIYKLFPTKSDIVKFLKQSIADGEELIKAQGDSGLTREIKYPWANQMVHGWFGWTNMLVHATDHYGQLVVYYRLNGMIPPASRPR